MSPTGRYSRVYHEILVDPKFLNVYDDDTLLATWLRLLILADQAYPSPATLPLDCDMEAVDHLCSVGILEHLSPSRYRIRGLQKERERRSAIGRTASSARWSTPSKSESKRHASADASAMRLHDDGDANAMPEGETEGEEEQAGEAEAGAEGSSPDHVDAYYRLTASWPSPQVVAWLDKMAADHGPDLLSRALAAEAIEDPERRTLLGRTQTRLSREAHERRKAAEAAARAAADKERRVVESMPEEQRQANIIRLRSMMASAGLAGERGEG